MEGVVERNKGSTLRMRLPRCVINSDAVNEVSHIVRFARDRRGLFFTAPYIPARSTNSLNTVIGAWHVCPAQT